MERRRRILVPYMTNSSQKTVSYISPRIIMKKNNFRRDKDLNIYDHLLQLKDVKREDMKI